MTPALQKMVEAMVEEVSRQVYTDYTTEDPSSGPFVNDLLVDGHLDLEKVARAGLEAIKELPDGLYADRGAMDPEVIGYDRDPETYWQAILAEILKETP